MKKVLKIVAVFAALYGIVKGIAALVEILNPPPLRRYIPIFESEEGEGFLEIDEESLF